MQHRLSEVPKRDDHSVATSGTKSVTIIVPQSTAVKENRTQENRNTSVSRSRSGSDNVESSKAMEEMTNGLYAPLTLMNLTARCLEEGESIRYPSLISGHEEARRFEACAREVYRHDGDGSRTHRSSSTGEPSTKSNASTSSSAGAASQSMRGSVSSSAYVNLHSVDSTFKCISALQVFERNERDRATKLNTFFCMSPREEILFSKTTVGYDVRASDAVKFTKMLQRELKTHDCVAEYLAVVGKKAKRGDMEEVVSLHSKQRAEIKQQQRQAKNSLQTSPSRKNAATTFVNVQEEAVTICMKYYYGATIEEVIVMQRFHVPLIENPTPTAERDDNSSSNNGKDVSQSSTERGQQRTCVIAAVSKPFNTSFIGRILTQIVSGLVHFHEHGFAHGNVRPDAVFVSSELRVKLFKPGCLSCRRGSESVARWRPPEWVSYKNDRGVWKGAREKAGDIWSLGCLALYMATALLPFPSVTDPVVVLSSLRLASLGDASAGAEVLRSIGNLHEISNPALQDLIKKCLTIDWRKRPTARELLTKDRFLVSSLESLQPFAVSSSYLPLFLVPQGSDGISPLPCAPIMTAEESLPRNSVLAHCAQIMADLRVQKKLSTAGEGYRSVRRNYSPALKTIYGAGSNGSCTPPLDNEYASLNAQSEDYSLAETPSPSPVRVQRHALGEGSMPTADDDEAAALSDRSGRLYNKAFGGFGGMALPTRTGCSSGGNGLTGTVSSVDGCDGSDIQATRRAILLQLMSPTLSEWMASFIIKDIFLAKNIAAYHRTVWNLFQQMQAIQAKGKPLPVPDTFSTQIPAPPKAHSNVYSVFEEHTSTLDVLPPHADLGSNSPTRTHRQTNTRDAVMPSRVTYDYVASLLESIEKNLDMGDGAADKLTHDETAWLWQNSLMSDLIARTLESTTLSSQGFMLSVLAARTDDEIASISVDTLADLMYGNEQKFSVDVTPIEHTTDVSVNASDSKPGGTADMDRSDNPTSLASSDYPVRNWDTPAAELCATESNHTLRMGLDSRTGTEKSMDRGDSKVDAQRSMLSTRDTETGLMLPNSVKVDIAQETHVSGTSEGNVGTQRCALSRKNLIIVIASVVVFIVVAVVLCTVLPLTLKK